MQFPCPLHAIESPDVTHVPFRIAFISSLDLNLATSPVNSVMFRTNADDDSVVPNGTSSPVKRRQLYDVHVPSTTLVVSR